MLRQRRCNAVALVDSLTFMYADIVVADPCLFKHQADVLPTALDPRPIPGVKVNNRHKRVFESPYGDMLLLALSSST